jgi:hypothetical protein
MKKLIGMLVLCVVATCAQAGVVRFRSSVRVNAPGVRVDVGRFPVRSSAVSHYPHSVQRSVIFRTRTVSSDVYGGSVYGGGTVSRGIVGYAGSMSSVLSDPGVSGGSCTNEGSVSRTIINPPMTYSTPAPSASVTYSAGPTIVQRQEVIDPGVTILRSVSYAQTLYDNHINRFPVVRSVFRTAFAPYRVVGRAVFRHHRR